MFASRRPDRSATCPVDGTLPSGRGPYVVTVPGMEAPVFHLKLPAGLNAAARLRVARKQLSDKLGIPAAALDLMPVRHGRSGPWNKVICIETAQRRRWCEAAPVREKRAQAVLPEYMVLPGAERTLSAKADGGLVHVRLGLDDGFTAPAALAADLLRAALADHDLQAAVLSGDLPRDFLDVVAEVGLSVAPGGVDDDRFTPFDLALDLRQAETAGSGETARTLRLWSAALVVSALAFGVWAASVYLETQAIARDTAALRRAGVDVLRAGILPDGPILDIRQQVMQRLEAASPGETSADSRALDRLSMLSVVLFGKGATVKSITYDPARGHAAVVHTRDFATAESLLADLRGTGFRTVDTSVRAQDDNTVELRFRLPPDTGEGE